MDIKGVLSAEGIVPNKALGQNFLTDSAAIEAITEAAETEGGNVLEIGAGLGALTHAINARAKKMLVVEIDRTMVDFLRKSEWENEDSIEIIHADFLKVSDAVLEEKLGTFRVVANLPYYVTTPIVMKLLKSALPIQSMTLMMQREAAEHFVAEPGTKLYSPLAVLTEYLFTVQTVLELSPQSYYPQPEVYSTVLHFEAKGADLSKVKLLSRVLTAAFSMRRKTIRNNLCNLGISKDEAGAILERCKIAENARAEQLTLTDFLEICAAYSDTLMP